MKILINKFVKLSNVPEDSNLEQRDFWEPQFAQIERNVIVEMYTT
jgi:hypothetical protein